MNKTLKRTVGTLALGAAASLAFASTSFAGNFSSVIGPSSSTFFSHVDINGQLFTGIRSSRIIVSSPANDDYDAWTYTNCTGQPMVPTGGYFNQPGTRGEYYCPGNSNLVNAQGYLNDRAP